ncbi:MAG: DNA adenine methylase [[Clostridium] innocuum]|uniref:DNA adenine methylase n=1 Tax=Clostridium sp. TaxID=1506 RepID=UPI0039910602
MNKRVLKAPFRWAGSKKSLLNELIDTFDVEKEIYVEPFLGSGVVLLNVLNNTTYKKYYVNDINSNIIKIYKYIQTEPSKLCESINNIVYDFNKLDDIEKSTYYYEIRNRYNDSNLEDIEEASYFWFLMSAGYNGVYRVNSNGKFNVPYGKVNKLNLDISHILEISNLLSNVCFYNLDYQDFFREIQGYANAQDFFVYCDPPYIAKSDSMKNQILYTSNKFIHEEFLLFLEQQKFFEKTSIMISMSKSQEADELYEKYFDMSRDMMDLLRKVNPSKKLKVIEKAFFNYIINLEEHDYVER